MIRVQKSLVTSLILISVFGAGVPMAILSWLQYQVFDRNLDVDFNARIQSKVGGVVESLKSPLWNFADDEALSILDEATRKSELIGMRITDPSGKILSAAGRVGSRRYDLISRDIVHNNRKIAVLEAWVDRDELQRQRQSYGFKLGLLNILGFICTVYLTLYFSNRRLSGRIFLLNRQFMELGSGNYHEAFVWPVGDEIDNLGRSLEITRRKLKHNISEIEKSRANLAALNKSLEGQVEERSSRLVQNSKMASLGEMAGGISHEINNPLGIIMGRAQRLRFYLEKHRDILPNAERPLADLVSIEKTVERIAVIVKSLRMISRNSEGDAYELCDLNQVVNDVLELCRNRFTNCSIDFRVQLLEEEVMVECQSVGISQILLNLLNNAFDAVEGQAERRIELELSAQETTVEVRVSDNGPGVPDQLRQKLMQPFFTTKPPGKGTGLGLSVSASIAKAHGGTLELENSPKTCFVLKLPRKQSQRGHQAA